MAEVCDAEIHIEATDGDGYAVLSCQLDKGHTGAHFRLWMSRHGDPAELEWNFDDCPREEGCDP